MSLYVLFLQKRSAKSMIAEMNGLRPVARKAALGIVERAAHLDIIPGLFRNLGRLVGEGDQSNPTIGDMYETAD